MLENMMEITREQILGTAQEMFFDGYRLVTITCVDNGDTFDLVYHYDRDLQLRQFRVSVGKEEEVQSISKIYFCALLVENEIKELFGVNVNGIVLDYDGRLLLSDGAPENPMACGGQIVIEKKA